MVRVRAKIDPKKIVGKIDPMIYGQYLEHVEDCIYPALLDESSSKANELGLRQDVIDMAREMQVPVIRWPGGCYADIYHWEDGIGPREERPTRLNWHWGGFESNRFGTDEFLTWCEATGAKPYINVNMGSGSLEEALRWLDYCNGTFPTADVKRRKANGREEPYDVEFWGLGNETWGPWEAGHCDAREYANRLREWAQFFRKVDPKVKLLGVGSQAGEDPDWDRQVIRTAGQYLDYLTIHMYGHTTHLFDPDDYYETVTNPVFFEERLRTFKQRIKEACEEYGIDRDIKISLDEWNIRHLELPAGAAQPVLKRSSLRTLKDALFVAGVFHAMHRLCDAVAMACYVFFVNGNAVLNVIEDTLIASTIAQVFKVYRELFVGSAIAVDRLDVPSCSLPVRQGRLESEVRSVDLVDLSAVITDSGELNIALINRHKEEVAQVLLELPEGYKPVRVRELYHDDVLAVNDLENPDKVVFKSLPVSGTEEITCRPHSLVIVECVQCTR